MAKKVIAIVKLQIPAGQATPAPPVGTAIAPHGVNIMEFTKSFNSKTADQQGMLIPVEMTIYADRTFDYITKVSPMAVLIKKELNLNSASGEPNKKKVGKLTQEQVRKIAELKMPDLNASSVESAMEMVAGTARSMGVEVEK